MDKFGRKFRDEHFNLLDKHVVSVNHGSYGLSPTSVFDKYVENLKSEYAYPDRFILQELKPIFEEAATLVANEYYHCDPHHVAFVQNATMGVNTVLKSLKFEKNDRIVITSTCYGACKNTVNFLAKREALELDIIQLDYPMEDEKVIELFNQRLPGAKLAMFDAITLMPGVIVPYAEITKLCQKYNVISLVDGAHAIGQIKLDLGNLQPDFFVSNLHKWLYVPRGCAALYVNPTFHNQIQTLPVSHSYVDEDIPANPLTLWEKFWFFGTSSFASVTTIRDAVKFRKEVCGGEELIAQYCRNLNEQVQELVAKKWPFAKHIENSTKTLTPYGLLSYWIEPEDFKNHFEFPETIDASDPKQALSLIASIDYILLVTYGARIMFTFFEGRYLVRFSFQTYNAYSDYEYLIDKLVSAFKVHFKSLEQPNSKI